MPNSTSTSGRLKLTDTQTHEKYNKLPWIFASEEMWDIKVEWKTRSQHC